MKEEADRCRTAAAIGNPDHPSKDSLCHLESLWVSDKKEDKSAVEGILGLEGEVGAHTIYGLSLSFAICDIPAIADW
jgi:hypothetical protein